MTMARVALAEAPLVPLRHLVEFNPRPRSITSEESCYLPMEAISEFGDVDSSRMRPTADLMQGYSFIRDGDVAYAKVTPCFENGKGMYAHDLPGGYAFATTEITVLRPRPGLEPSYLAWVLQSDGFRSPGESHMSGAGGLKRVPEAYAASFRIPSPRPSVQRAIADFLDRETAQIDAFIAKNEQLIALLTERRAAAVDELLRSSWSGAEALKIGWLFTFHNGDRGASYPSRDEFVEDGVPFVNAGHLRNGTVDYHEMNYVTEEKFNEMGGAKLQPGDLLFCLRGSVGKLGLFHGDSSGSLASSLVALRSRNRGSAHERYFLHLLQCSEARDAIDLAQTGSAQPNLSVEQLAQLRLPVPDVHVQRRTADRIERVAAVIDDAMHAADRAVMLAAERRAALISAAVTGKIDVGVSA